MVLCICEIVPSHLIASWLVWSRKRVYAAFTLPIRPITSSNQFIKAGNGDYSRVSCSNVYTVCVVFFAMASIFFLLLQTFIQQGLVQTGLLPHVSSRKLGLPVPVLPPTGCKQTLSRACQIKAHSSWYTQSFTNSSTHATGWVKGIFIFSHLRFHEIFQKSVDQYKNTSYCGTLEYLHLRSFKQLLGRL